MFTTEQAEAHAKIFSGGGKPPIHYLLDQIKPYICKQNLAERFKPNVNMALFKKMLQFGQHVEQTDVIQVYYGRESGGKVPSCWAIFAIFGKK